MSQPSSLMSPMQLGDDSQQPQSHSLTAPSQPPLPNNDGPSSSSIPSSSAPSHRQINGPLCPAFQEELRNDYNLLAGDPCGVCNHLVVHHLRQSTVTLQHQVPSPTFQSPMSTASNDPYINIANRTAPLFRSMKPLIPMWSRSLSAFQFVNDLQRVLSISEIPFNDWYKIFSYISDDSDISSWIYKNIVSVPHMSFDRAKNIFISHFERVHSRALLMHDFQKCIQRPQESVQDYADRFQAFCYRLNIQDDDILAIEQFKNHLALPIREKLLENTALAKALGHAPSMDTLSQVIQLSIDLDVAINTTRRQLHQDRPPQIIPHRQQMGRRGGFGRGHSGSAPHQQSRSSRPEQSAYTTSTTSEEWLSSVQCYHCGQFGHYAPDCPNGTDLSNITCHKCNAKGHYANACPLRSTSIIIR